MNGNTFGTIFRVTTWGESHGPAIGAIVDGCPSGIPLSTEDFQKDLRMRQGGNQNFTTPRKESDQVIIESGVFEGITTGSPISLRIENKNQKSEDYDSLKTVFRPGHADLTTYLKQGHRDPRGGGRASARETAARVAAGVVAKKILSRLGVEIAAWVQQVGPHAMEFDIEGKTLSQLKQFRSYSRLGTLEVRPEIEQQLETLKQVGDSWGGAITCAIAGLAPGLGEPIFDKTQSLLAHAVLSLPAAVGFEIGSGKEFSMLPGSAIRDEIGQTPEGPRPKTNKSAGLLGGLTTGNLLFFSAYFHAPTSIPRNISSVNEKGEPVDVMVQGRHDCFPLPRAIPMIEAMAAITMADLCLRAGRIPEKL